MNVQPAKGRVGLQENSQPAPLPPLTTAHHQQRHYTSGIPAATIGSDKSQPP